MALTKVSRGLLSTSIVDNGNATAITIDSSENVSFTGAATFSGNVNSASLQVTGNDISASLGSAFEAFVAADVVYTGALDRLSGNYREQRQSASNYSWYTGVTTVGGTALKMNLDNSGNLGIGLANPSAYYAKNLVVAAATEGGITIKSASTDQGYLMFADGTSGSDAYRGYISHNHADDATYLVSFGTVNLSSINETTFSTSNTERLRINASGYLKAKANGGTYYNGTYHELINNNNVSGDRCLVLGNNAGSATNNTASKTITIADNVGDRLFIYGNGDIVNQNNSYGSLSDVKLKENITDATPKLAGINQIRVVNYNLISNPDVKQLGVVAQELEQIFPSMVDETPDSTFYEEAVLDADGNPVVDADGNNVTERKEKLTGESTKSVKYSVFVPMLIKAMQEQQAIIEALTARLEALEGA
jgi:hypothetical protein